MSNDFSFDDIGTTKRAKKTLKTDVDKFKKKLQASMHEDDRIAKSSIEKYTGKYTTPRIEKLKKHPSDVIGGINIIEDADIGYEDKIPVYTPAEKKKDKPKIVVATDEESFGARTTMFSPKLAFIRRTWGSTTVEKTPVDRHLMVRLPRPGEREAIRKRVVTLLEGVAIPGAETPEEIAEREAEEAKIAEMEKAAFDIEQRKKRRRKELESKLVEPSPKVEAPVKRKPGRPKKVVEPSEQVAPKKIGRPRKNQDELSEDSRSSLKRVKNADNNLPDDDDEILVTTDYPLKKIDEVSLEKIKSVFGEKSDAILELLDVGNSDGALSLTIKTLMHTLITILPKVEGYVNRTDGQKGVYQLTQLISQIRDTCADIQAYRDKTNLGLQMVERYLRPGFLDIAAQIMQAWMQLETAAGKNMSKEDLADFKSSYAVPIRLNLSDYLTKKYEELSTSLVQSLN